MGKDERNKEGRKEERLTDLRYRDLNPFPHMASKIPEKALRRNGVEEFGKSNLLSG